MPSSNSLDNNESKIETREDSKNLQHPTHKNTSKNSLETLHHKNSQFDSITYRLQKNEILHLPSEFNDYYLLAFHCWNFGTGASIVNVAFECENEKIVKPNCADFMRFVQFNKPLKIKNLKIYVTQEKNNEVPDSIIPETLNQYKNKLDYVDLISIFVAKKVDFTPEVSTEEIDLGELDFSFLMEELKLNWFAQIMKSKQAELNKEALMTSNEYRIGARLLNMEIFRISLKIYKVTKPVIKPAYRVFKKIARPFYRMAKMIYKKTKS